jgi:hypothetical protein
MREEPVIVLYTKNRPWSGEPRCDYVRVMSEWPPVTCGYRIDGARLVTQTLPPGYLERYWGWYHPATSWEIEEYRRLGGPFEAPASAKLWTPPNR